MDAYLLVQKLEGGVSVLGVWEYSDDALVQGLADYFRARNLYVQHWDGDTLLKETAVN
jgi:hypothetical protein